MIRRTTADGIRVTISNGQVIVGHDYYTRKPFTPTQAAIFGEIVGLIDADEIRLAIGITRANLSLAETIRRVAKVS
jgi:hypothetical protein